jgi:lipopolysaccharide transport system permease protein
LPGTRIHRGFTVHPSLPSRAELKKRAFLPPMVSEHPSYEVRINRRTSWRRVDWRGLWDFRDLLVLLVRRDFLSRYSQTILGPLWFLLQPLVTTALFTVVFSGVAKISTDGSPALLFYLSGMLPWNYFANTFSACGLTLTANAGLFGKVYFPRLIVPLSCAVSNVIAFVIHLALTLVVYVVFMLLGRENVGGLKWMVCLLPLLLVQVAALAVGAGLWMSALTTKYRDLTHLSGFILNLWFYATPVIFPLSIVPDRLKIFVILNPMTFVEEAFRYLLLGNGSVDWTCAVASIPMTIVLFCTGVLAFQRCERSFIDTV